MKIIENNASGKSLISILNDNDHVIADVLLQGATLNSVILAGEQVISGYDLSAEVNLAECRSAWLFPFPNRLENGVLHFNGNSYHWLINEPGRGHAIHGFVSDKPFELREKTAQSTSAAIRLGYRYEGNQDYFPFPFDFEVTYLITENQMDITVKITNMGNEEMPFGLGWHPYIRATNQVDKLELSFPRADHIQLSDRLIPTGASSPFSGFVKTKAVADQKWDDLFQLHDPFAVKWKHMDSRNQYLMTADQHFRFLQFYIPDDRKSIAIEPMTCSINALNSGDGLLVLSSKNFLTFHIQISQSR